MHIDPKGDYLIDFLFIVYFYFFTTIVYIFVVHGLRAQKQVLRHVQWAVFVFPLCRHAGYTSALIGVYIYVW